MESSRAVGSAIGSNPVAFFIPCHRVIQTSGTFGNYMWGAIRKTAMIGWEGTKRGEIGRKICFGCDFSRCIQLDIGNDHIDAFPILMFSLEIVVSF